MDDPIMDALMQRANALVERLRDQKTVMEEMRRVYMLDWGENLGDKASYIRETRDTQPYDSINWAVDVLCSNTPSIEIKIPRVIINTKRTQQPLSNQEVETGNEVLEAIMRAAFGTMILGA